MLCSDWNSFPSDTTTILEVDGEREEEGAAEDDESVTEDTGVERRFRTERNTILYLPEMLLVTITQEHCLKN